MRPIADVKISQGMDRLVIVPRRPDEVGGIRAALKTLAGGTQPRRSAQGLTLPAHAVEPLLHEGSDLDLRWSDEARRFAENRSNRAERHEACRHVVEEIRQLPRTVLESRLDRLDDVQVLDDHQVRNVVAMAHPDCQGLCLFDEQGAGKTVSAIFAWDLLSAADVIDFGLIVAPKSMVAEWARDIDRFRPGMYSVAVAAGSRASKLAALRSQPDLLITNFDSGITLEHELTAHLRRLDGRALLIVDESFFVKNRDARRTQSLRRLREWCGRAFVLCGTPAPNAAHDVIEQFNLADLGATFHGVDVPVDRDMAQQVVNATLVDRGVYLRSLKHEVLPDLPSKSFDIVRLKLEGQQRAAYEAALASLIIDLRDASDEEFRKNLTSFMARRAALLQICSNPVRIVPGYDETPVKLAALDELLERFVVRGAEKVVVWSSYRASLDAIVQRFDHLGVVRYDGSVTDVASRREVVRAFQEDDAARVFVGNPAAAGAGLTLHAARIAVYESMTNQAAHYLQSLDRIHRRGQERDVRYIVLLGEGTVEEREFELLRSKEQAAQDLLGDVVRVPPTRDTLLNELMRSGGAE